MHKGAFDPCKIEAAGAVPALSTISFPSSHLGEGTRLLTGIARFETVGGSQFLSADYQQRPVAQLDSERRATNAEGGGSSPSRSGQNLQSVGEPGRPYLPWKQGIAGSNPARLTTSKTKQGARASPGFAS